MLAKMPDYLVNEDGAVREWLTPKLADNYNHLHEQPTIFYALMFFAVLTGGADAATLGLAWAYVVLRVLHSLVQATFNRVIVRFSIFALATFTLMAMAAREALRLLG